MLKIIIDFNKISEETGKRLFAGRENGKQGQILFGLNSIEKDVIFDITIGTGIVVSSSYYFGLLKEHVIIFNNGNEFLEKVYFYELKEDLHNLIKVFNNVNYMNKYDTLECVKMIRKIKSDMENNI